MGDILVDRLFQTQGREEYLQECGSFLSYIGAVYVDAYKKSGESDLPLDDLEADAPPTLDPEVVNPLDILTPYLQQLKAFFKKEGAQSPKKAVIDELQQNVRRVWPNITEKRLTQCITLLKMPSIYIALSLKSLLHKEPYLKAEIDALIYALRFFDEQNPLPAINAFSQAIDKAPDLKTRRILEKGLADFSKRCLKDNAGVYRHEINYVFIRQRHKEWFAFSSRFNYKRRPGFEREMGEYINRLSALNSIEDFCAWFEQGDRILNDFLTTKKEKSLFSKFLYEQKKRFYKWLMATDNKRTAYIRSTRREDEETYPVKVMEYHMRHIQQWLGKESARLQQEQRSPLYRARLFLQRKVGGRKRDDSEDDRNLILKLTRDADIILDKSRHENDYARFESFYQQLNSAKDYLKSRRRREYPGEDSAITTHLATVVRSAAAAFSFDGKLNGFMTECFNHSLFTQLDAYEKKRERKKIFKGLMPNFTSIRNTVFDFLVEGKQIKGHATHDTFDGLTHRKATVKRLTQKANTCINIEDYIAYCAICLNELDNIFDKKSKLRRIILAQIDLIIRKKILTKGTVLQKLEAFEMLYSKGKQKSYQFPGLPLLEKSLLQEKTINFPLIKAKMDSLKDEHPAINNYLEKELTAATATVPVATPAKINGNPALKEFHDTLLTKLTNELAALKIAATGKFTLMPEILTSAGYFAPLSMAKLAEHIAFPLVASMASASMTGLAQGVIFADQYMRRRRYQNISQILPTTEYCEKVAQSVATNLTKIWEYQIQQVYALGNSANVRALADCALMRMIDFLVNQEYLRYGDTPLNVQLCFAVRGHKLRHGVTGCRLSTRECTSSFSDQAWIVEEVFESTPILLADGTLCSSGAALDKNGVPVSRYGAARDGKEIAELLYWAKVPSPFAGTKYGQYRYHTRAPQYNLNKGPTKAELKQELDAMKAKNQHLQQRSVRQARQLKTQAKQLAVFESRLTALERTGMFPVPADDAQNDEALVTAATEGITQEKGLSSSAKPATIPS